MSPIGRQHTRLTQFSVFTGDQQQRLRKKKEHRNRAKDSEPSLLPHLFQPQKFFLCAEPQRAFSSTGLSSLSLCPWNLSALTTAVPHFSPSLFVLYPHLCISEHLAVSVYNWHASDDEANTGNCVQQNMLKTEAGWHLHKPLQAAQLHEEHGAALPATLATAAQPQNSPSPGPAASPPSYFPPFSWECVLLTLKSAQMHQCGARAGAGSSESEKPSLENKSLRNIPKEQLNGI